MKAKWRGKKNGTIIVLACTVFRLVQNANAKGFLVVKVKVKSVTFGLLLEPCDSPVLELLAVSHYEYYSPWMGCWSIAG